MHFGIREHGMAAALNGMSLSGLRPYGATFFVFTDYLRPSLRLSSIMHQPVLYVMTHDSIGLGEDGPTHQPVEHLAACRAIPGVYVFRPGDANEVIHCYIAAIKMDNHPSVMVLSRQNVPTLDRTNLGAASGAEKGGYVLSDCEGTPQVILMATGTEVPIVMDAAKKLSADGVKVRVVSMPCMELCEAGIRLCWDKYIGLEGHFVGMSSFGASAPAPKLYEHFKITPDQVAIHAKLAIQG
jgi:transketolase